MKNGPLLLEVNHLKLFLVLEYNCISLGGMGEISKSFFFSIFSKFYKVYFRDLKRQLEHSGLRLDTSNLVLNATMCFCVCVCMCVCMYLHQWRIWGGGTDAFFPSRI